MAPVMGPIGRDWLINAPARGLFSTGQLRPIRLPIALPPAAAPWTADHDLEIRSFATELRCRRGPVSGHGGAMPAGRGLLRQRRQCICSASPLLRVWHIFWMIRKSGSPPDRKDRFSKPFEQGTP